MKHLVYNWCIELIFDLLTCLGQGQDIELPFWFRQVSCFFFSEEKISICFLYLLFWLFFLSNLLKLFKLIISDFLGHWRYSSESLPIVEIQYVIGFKLSFVTSFLFYANILHITLYDPLWGVSALFERSTFYVTCRNFGGLSWIYFCLLFLLFVSAVELHCTSASRSVEPVQVKINPIPVILTVIISRPPYFAISCKNSFR